MTRLVEDRALRESFRRGERAALGEVYREYARSVFVLVRQGFTVDSGGRVVRVAGLTSRAELEATVQEVFARAFAERARLAYDGVRPYRNYLFTIARNLVADGLRGSRRVTVSLDDETGEGPRKPLGLIVEAEGAQRHGDAQLEARLEAFIRGLDADEQAVFRLRFEDGLSVDETARRLETTTHRIKSVQSRLRRRLFVELRRHGFFEGYAWDGQSLARVRVLVWLLVGVEAWRS